MRLFGIFGQPIPPSDHMTTDVVNGRVVNRFVLVDVPDVPHGQPNGLPSIVTLVLQFLVPAVKP